MYNKQLGVTPESNCHCKTGVLPCRVGSPCIWLLNRKASSSLSTVLGSKQKVLMFSSKYQLRFSSVTLNIRANFGLMAVVDADESLNVPKKAIDFLKSIPVNLLGATSEGMEFPHGKLSQVGKDRATRA